MVGEVWQKQPEHSAENVYLLVRIRDRLEMGCGYLFSKPDPSDVSSSMAILPKGSMTFF